MEALRLRAPAPGHVGRLDERPGEVFVAIAPVAFTLLLAVGDPRAVDAARIGAVVAYRREALNRPALEHDDRGQDLGDARCARQHYVLGSEAHVLEQVL